MSTRILVPTCHHIRKEMLIQYVGAFHLDLVLRHGAQPIMIPTLSGMEPYLEEQLDEADGLLLVEGEDVHPDRYNPAPESRRYVKELNVERDRVEFFLAQGALARGLPILGICRGSHLLNVAAGGTMYTDVIKDRTGSHRHIDYDNYHGFRHPVRFEPGTWLAELFGVEQLPVNSYHHQSVRDLPSGYEPLAYADDGVLEGFHDPRAPFVVGLQFHPERMQQEHPACPAIFRRFVQVARQRATA
jgi:gamma-glutamyl-gamma-aminobutyrate hydrolase PuuD